MKLIIAYVQPERLVAVKQALTDNAVGKMSVTNALGCGQQGGYTESYRGAEMEINLLKKVRFEVAVNDDYVEPCVEAICSAARSGESGAIGDGKIFVLDLGDCIRIRTGERGHVAVG